MALTISIELKNATLADLNGLLKAASSVGAQEDAEVMLSGSTLSLSIEVDPGAAAEEYPHAPKTSQNPNENSTSHVPPTASDMRTSTKSATHLPSGVDEAPILDAAQTASKLGRAGTETALKFIAHLLEDDRRNPQ